MQGSQYGKLSVYAHTHTHKFAHIRNTLAYGRATLELHNQYPFPFLPLSLRLHFQ